MADDLDRLFERLVRVLAEDTPGRLAVPFPACEVYERLVPYRSNRSILRVATRQDYEMAVLRLLSGERGYASLEPGDIREALRREAGESNADTGLFRQFPDAILSLNRIAAERFLRGDGAYAPPPPTLPLEPSQAGEVVERPTEMEVESPFELGPGESREATLRFDPGGAHWPAAERTLTVHSDDPTGDRVLYLRGGKETPEIHLRLRPVTTVADVTALRREALNSRLATLGADEAARRQAAIGLYTELFPRREPPTSDEALYDELTRETPTPPRALRTLATERVAAVRDALVKAGIAAERLEPLESRTTVESEGTARVEFEITH